MNDQQFIAAFEAAHLNAFDHRAHIRMGWLYLRAQGWAGGTAKIRSGLQHFAAQAGVPQKYHETITLFWAHLVYHAILQQPDISTFDSFIEAYPHLLDSRLLSHHYHPATLAAARDKWIEPDLIPLPTVY